MNYKNLLIEKERNYLMENKTYEDFLKFLYKHETLPVITEPVGEQIKIGNTIGGEFFAEDLVSALINLRDGKGNRR